MNRHGRDWGRPDWLDLTFTSTILEAAMDRYFSRFPRNRCDVMAEDWDTLLVLDGCRFDLFSRVHDLSGTLDSRLSRGSNTGEFFEENFTGTRHHDTVYVTANPVPRVEKWCSVDIDEVFHAVVDVWEDNWDEAVNTVRPEPVADAIRRAHADYPDKRIIGHFIQPHQPFIGPTGRKIDERGMRAVDVISGDDGDGCKKVWDQVEDGDLSVERARRAYAENLELVFPQVDDLCETIPEKTVVTADHGNMFGEFAWPFPVRTYGHPGGVHARKLIKVPWLETGFETRREVTSERPRERTETDTERDERLDRLEHLGYR